MNDPGECWRCGRRGGQHEVRCPAADSQVVDPQPGEFVEFYGAAPGGKKGAKPLWRPAIFAGPRKDGMLIFRWTDNKHFTWCPKSMLATLVRKPQGDCSSQERFVRDYGELT